MDKLTVLENCGCGKKAAHYIQGIIEGHSEPFSARGYCPDCMFEVVSNFGPLLSVVKITKVKNVDSSIHFLPIPPTPPEEWKFIEEAQAERASSE